MWVEELKNGKFKFVERYEDYLTGQIKKVSVTLDKNTAQSRKIAVKVLEEKIAKALTNSKPVEATMKILVDEYLKDQERTVKKSTYTRNYHACNRLKELLGNDTIVERMTAKYVRDKLLSTGKEPGTLNGYLTRFRALVRWGYKNDLVRSISFLDKLEAFKDTPHKIKIQDKYLESSELKALLAGMEEPFWRLLTKFLTLSGLRFGEAAALQKTDIDLDNRVIHISKTFDSVNREVTSAKSVCSIRDVYIQPELESVIRQINSLMLKRRLMYCIKKSDLFMFSTDSEHIHYYAYNKYLRENSLQIVGRAITVHALRHTHASLLLEQGVSIDIISRRLGHENSRITKEIYLHITEKLKEKDNQKIAEIKIL